MTTHRKHPTQSTHQLSLRECRRLVKLGVARVRIDGRRSGKARYSPFEYRDKPRGLITLPVPWFAGDPKSVARAVDGRRKEIRKATDHCKAHDYDYGGWSDPIESPLTVIDKLISRLGAKWRGSDKEIRDQLGEHEESEVANGSTIGDGSEGGADTLWDSVNGLADMLGDGGGGPPDGDLLDEIRGQARQRECLQCQDPAKAAGQGQGESSTVSEVNPWDPSGQASSNGSAEIEKARPRSENPQSVNAGMSIPAPNFPGTSPGDQMGNSMLSDPTAGESAGDPNQIGSQAIRQPLGDNPGTVGQITPDTARPSDLTESDGPGRNPELGKAGSDDCRSSELDLSAMLDGPDAPSSYESSIVEGSAKDGSGGWTADTSGARGSAESLSRESKDIKRSLERIFDEMEVSAYGDESPRISGSKLVRERIARRLDLGRCHKSELENKKYLILCDVSGSCSHVATPTLAACFAMAKEDPERYIIVAHSNGCVDYDYQAGSYDTDEELIHGCDPREILSSDRDGYWGFKISLDKLKDQIAGVVAFGDTDAEDLYQRIAAADIPLIWLDHGSRYSYRRGRRDSAQPERAKWDSYRRESWSKGLPMAAWTNVTGARTAAIALRKIAKEVKGK